MAYEYDVTVVFFDGDSPSGRHRLGRLESSTPFSVGTLIDYTTDPSGEEGYTDLGKVTSIDDSGEPLPQVETRLQDPTEYSIQLIRSISRDSLVPTASI